MVYKFYIDALILTCHHFISNNYQALIKKDMALKSSSSTFDWTLGSSERKIGVFFLKEVPTPPLSTGR